MTGPPPASLHEVGTLVDLLRFRRETCGDRTFLEMLGEQISFAELARQSERYAVAFRRRGVGKGDRLAIILPTSKEFLFSFFGAQCAGAIPVPLYPNAPPARIGRIVIQCRARAVFGMRKMFGAAADQLVAAVPGLDLIDVAEIPPVERGEEDQLPGVGPDDPAFLQYTSGSTGEPKGVQLTHRNLLANMRAIIERMQHDAGEVGVSWLPLYHDMGLIGFIFCPLYSASRIIVLAPDLGNPGAWLDAIQRHRAQFTAAPDFAYRLCNLLPDVSGFDLRSLRVAYSGGEPVRGSTIRAFQQRFGLGHVVAPAYGLAETALCVATGYPGKPIAVDPNGFVSVGRPISGTVVRIVEDGRALPPNQAGEIEVRAESNTSGYWARPEEHDSLFSSDGFLRTGDIGYLDPEGNLFVVGRKKHIIIRGGQNIAPQELEEAADAVTEIRFSAAIGCEIEQYGASEQILVFAEARNESLSADDYGRIAQKIRQAIKDRVGFFPNQVYLVRPRTIPRTANGKIQHVALREAFLRGAPAHRAALLYPAPSSEP